MSSSSGHVLSLDVGTTKIRALVYDGDGEVVAQADERVALVYPSPGRVEIEPAALWDSVKKVLREAITACGSPPIAALGISTQRASFVTWNRQTGREFHNFITWKDVRADDLVKEWNESLSFRGLRAGAGLLYFFTRQRRYRVASILKLQNKMVTMRLLWALNNVPELSAAASENNALFGTIDSWLVYKLNKGRVHVSDIGNASATGLYDPFTLQYGGWAFKLFGLPMAMMPEVVDSAGDHFGTLDCDFTLGLQGGPPPIPIRAVMADQSAGMFGSGCFSKGDTKMTLGTGSFLDVNTGDKPHASINGLIPVVGWKFRDQLVFIAEGSNHDTGSLIEWARKMKLFDDPKDSSAIAMSCREDSSLYFIPAFCGLQAPILDPSAAAGLIGLKAETTPEDMTRSVLEAIAFTMKQLQETMAKESDYTLHNIQIDGGVSTNDFVVQLISSLTGKQIHRATSSEMSAFGAAFLAGLEAGVWKSPRCISVLRSIERTFEPETEPGYLRRLYGHYERWIDACHRFTFWNSNGSS